MSAHPETADRFGGRPGDRRRSGGLLGPVISVLGDRFGDARTDPDGKLHITVIDLTDDDVAALQSLAGQAGAGRELRIERADPATVQTWERLRHDLRSMAAVRPRLLQQYPSPDRGYRRPPVEIHLTPNAEQAAADLHAAYGDFVSLRVGAFPYPPQPEQDTPPMVDWRGQPSLVNPEEIDVELDGPLSIRRGETVTHGLLLTNLGEDELSIRTIGQLTASILDPATGATVGGFTGPQRLPMVVFTAPPAQTVRVPLLVGTASFQPRLGYTVPVGHWQLTAPMQLGDGRRLRTPALDVTITD